MFPNTRVATSFLLVAEIVVCSKISTRPFPASGVGWMGVWGIGGIGGE